MQEQYFSLHNNIALKVSRLSIAYKLIELPPVRKLWTSSESLQCVARWRVANALFRLARQYVKMIKNNTEVSGSGRCEIEAEKN